MFPGTQGGPLEHVIAAKAVAFREALQPEFTAYCQQVVSNAQTLAKAFIALGGSIVSGGTDNHLMLMDLRSRGMESLTGKLAENALNDAGITVNKNTVPKETRSPFVTSGIRIGTPAVTTRGMKDGEMHRIASLIDRVLQAPEDADNLRAVHADVKELAAGFPLYPAPVGAGV
jgi:glycine hydroxymethyltransferase